MKATDRGGGWLRGAAARSTFVASLHIGLVVAVACASGVTVSNEKRTPTASSTTSPTATPSLEATVSALRVELERVTAEELAHGCTTSDRFGQRVFCGESKAKVDRVHAELVAAVLALEKRDSAVARATELIKEITDDPQREVTFQGVSGNPYTATGKQIEKYRDELGFEFWVDPAADRVVQFGPGPDSTLTFARVGDLSLAELRARAEAYLLRTVEGFRDVQASFVHRASTTDSGSRYAFRWEAPEVPQGERLAPFVQVVLSPTGEVMSFTDSRSLY